MSGNPPSVLAAFLTVLDRMFPRIGYGLRYDHSPEGTAVMVEFDNDTGCEWWFDADGNLVSAEGYEIDPNGDRVIDEGGH